MKLYVSAGSPYSRRARIAVREAGLDDQTEEVNVNELPDRTAALLALGPGGKIPTLELDNSAVLTESMLIAHYLDVVSDGKLYPADGAELANRLRIETVGAVLMDSLHDRSKQSRLDPSEQSPGYIAKEVARSRRCYDTLQSMLDLLSGQTHFSALTIACSLSYADWRGAEDNWRDSYPELDAWMKEIEKHPSVAATARPGE